MPDPYRKVNPGDDLEFPAATWNSMLDVVRETAGISAATPTGSPRQATIVRVKNESGSDLNRNSILGLSTPIFAPEESEEAENAFLREVAFRGVTPDETLHKRRYVVLLDPAPDGQFARAYLAGVCQVKVDIIDPSHEFANIEDGSTDGLVSSRHGHAQILWTQGDDGYGAYDGYGYGTGLQWAIVRLGVTMSCVAVGKANGDIAPRDGTTYGTGRVDIYRSLDGEEDGPIETIDVLNASADEMAYGAGILGGKYVSVAWDADDVAWVAPLEC